MASQIDIGPIVRRWTLQDAKNGLSALIRQVKATGPQRITLHGRDVAVVMAVEEYDQLTGGNMNLIESLRRSPLAAAVAAGALVIERSRDTGRDIEL